MKHTHVNAALSLVVGGIVAMMASPARAEGPTSLPAATSVTQRRCQLAYVLLWNKNYPAAEEEFRKTLTADEKCEDARIGLAMTLERKGDLAAAATEYNRIPADSPQFRAAAAGQARILTSQRKFQPAIELYEKLKKDNALTDEYRLKYVETLGLAGQPDRALAELAPLRDNPKMAVEIARLEGLILFWGGRSKEAVPKLRDALTKTPEDDGLRLDLAQALVGAQAYDEAEAVMEKLSSASAGSPKAVLLRSDILVAQKQFDRAADLIRSALKADSKADALKVRLAEVLSWTGKYDESIKAYRDYLETNRDDNQVRAKLAETLTWAGKFDEAATEYRTALGETGK